MSKTAEERNFQRYQRAVWIHPDNYPLEQAVDTALYRPVAVWMGRLVLPEFSARDQEGGCLFEVHHTDPDHTHLIGQQVVLRYAQSRSVQSRNWSVARNVIFNKEANELAQKGLILAERINHWRLVSALESLAASHPTDDVIVRLSGPVMIEEPASGTPVLRIEQEPVQISGRYMGLVQFLRPEEGDGHRWRVRHYDPATHSFQGAESVVSVPPPIANEDNTFPSTSHQIDTSPLNATGWYVYGAPSRDGLFVVQGWTPRALVQLEPDRVALGSEASWQHVRHEAWSDLVAKKGTATSVLCDPRASDAAAARAGWKVGDRALLLHVYAGIGGKLREPAAKARLYFGHFAFGVAEVIHEPLADEPSFAITFYQIYTQNVDGLIAGSLDWSLYMGDRQFGWSGLRPTCNILVKLDELDDKYIVDGKPYSVMDAIERNLELMAARYRIGDGRGATFVAAANNCSQDAGQAFYAAIVEVGELIQTSRNLEAWTAANPEQAARLQRVRDLGKTLRLKLVGGNARRNDWRYSTENLGISENPFKNLLRGLGTWRTLFPRKASDTYAQAFLDHGAALWVLGTYQIGGIDPDIEPIPAWTF